MYIHYSAWESPKNIMFSRSMMFYNEKKYNILVYLLSLRLYPHYNEKKTVYSLPGYIDNLVPLH